YRSRGAVRCCWAVISFWWKENWAAQDSVFYCPVWRKMPARRVLVVDDEENIGRSLRLILEREGYAVSLCHSVTGFRDFPGRADVYLLDVKLPDGSGIDLLRTIRASDPAAPVVMI